MPLLDEVVAVAPNRVTAWADDERGGFAGIGDLLVGAGPETAVYVCGPTGMLDAARSARSAAREHAGGVGPFGTGAVRTGGSVRAGRHARRRPDHPVLKVRAGQVDRPGRTAEGDDDMLAGVSRANGGRVIIDT
jgi:hypothetical protein